MVKLCADAGVQSEVGDEVRGRVFALYDAVFNVCYVLAIAVAALLAPPTGVAPWLVAGDGGGVRARPARPRPRAPRARRRCAGVS